MNRLPHIGLPALLLCALGGCASIPKGQYGVESIEIEGADALSGRAIERCLLTRERARLALQLGLSASECGAPPFDEEPPRLDLFAWPWTQWTGLNVAVLEMDLQRVERFYRARGFYDARVLALRYDPPRAGDPELEPPPDACDPESQECTVRLTIEVHEGEPLHVGSVTVEGLDGLPPEVASGVMAAPLPSVGDRFDEHDYDRGKQQLADALAEASHAEARVTGEVLLDHGARRATITYRVTPGPAYRFGRVRVEGHAGLPAAPIIAAAGIERGAPFRQSALAEVQQEVYALGAFSSVEVERELDRSTREVHLRVTVAPLPHDSFRVGIGITSGTLQRTEGGALESVPQWDAHLFGRYERRHVFGTLGKLRIEDRPRLIQQAQFPRAADTQPGNILRVRLTEPGLIEARTELSAEARWDYGPDPFLGFLRSDVVTRTGLRRGFLERRLFGAVALQHDRFIVASGTSTSDGSEVPRSYLYSFVDEELRVDLRDDEVQPRKGLLLVLASSQSVRNPVSDWTTVRLAPDLRGFLPLPFGMVLGGRFALAALFVSDPATELDATSQRLGPAAYRLRGGGSQSNRGYVAGELGVGVQGGIRRWEASAELRVRMGESFSVATFYDMGDVNDGARFRFDQTNPSAGFGFRYLTLVGAIRADLGFRLGPDRERGSKQFLVGAPGALHLTIGEAF